MTAPPAMEFKVRRRCHHFAPYGRRRATCAPDSLERKLRWHHARENPPTSPRRPTGGAMIHRARSELLCWFAFACLSSPLSAAPYAYVSNEGSGSVTVIDIATDRVVADWKIGGKPRGIAIDPGGDTLYVSEQTSGSLMIVDTASGATRKQVPLGRSPEAIYRSPDGQWVAAAIEENDQVVLVRVSDHTPQRHLGMRGKNPEHAVFSPDGKWLYVSAEEADSIDIVDVAR